MDILGYLEAFWTMLQSAGSLLYWVFNNLKSLFSIVLMPFNFFFSFISSFIKTSFNSSIIPISFLPEGMNSFLTAIPFWSTITNAIVITLYALTLFYIFNRLKDL